VRSLSRCARHKKTALKNGAIVERKLSPAKLTRLSKCGDHLGRLRVGGACAYRVGAQTASSSATSANPLPDQLECLPSLIFHNMTGLEIPGLVFGVVPVVVEILSSYGTARRRLSTFSRYTEVAHDIQLKFDAAAANFNNECRLLLQAAIARPSDISEMMDDPTHKSWQEQGKEMEQRLRDLMQQDYELCKDIVTQLRKILCDTANSLSKLKDSPDEAKQSKHKYAQELWKAFNTSRKENDYLRQLKELNRWNKSFGKLCKQRHKMQKRSSVPSSACIIRKAVPRSYQQIRVASQQLGQSIHESWSCTNTSHSGHQAKLSLDAKSEHDNVQLDVVIACQPKLNIAIQKYVRMDNFRSPTRCIEIILLTTVCSSSTEVPIWLQIRSITSVVTYGAPTSHPPTLGEALSHGMGDASRVNTPTPPIKGKSKKRVRIDDPRDSTRSVRAVTTSDDSAAQARSFVMLDLKTTDSVCCHVTRVRSSASECQDSCVGFLEVAKSQPTTRFMFYDASRLATNDVSSCTKRQGALPIHNLVHRFQILQKITLAHKLAEAVLQYHSTSWLPQAWTLQDVAYFTDQSQADANNIAKALDSLHLSNRFPDHAPLDTEPQQSSLDLKQNFGIRNLTLAKLGVALLEICAQTDITIPSPGIPAQTREIIAARKLLDEQHHSTMDLGSRYLGVVRKCLYCDFSCGDDLNGEALQSAVYTEVVCTLQDMKTQWKKVFGL